MHKLCNLFMIILVMMSFSFSQEIFDTPGPHTLWDGDTLRTDSILTASDFLYTKDFNRVHVWIKTTNPVDSTGYRAYYYIGFTQSDVFAVPVDTSGAESGNAIVNISDTLWYYNSFTTTALYTQIRLSGNGADHGNRACVWLKVFLSED